MNFDPQTGVVTGDNGTTILTRSEATIFRLLTARGGRLVSNDSIYSALYDHKPDSAGGGTVRVFVYNLRRKLLAAGVRAVIVGSHDGYVLQIAPPGGARPGAASGFLPKLGAVAVVAAALFCGGGAMAAPPTGADMTGSLHKWFEQQHSVVGAWCCDVSDGHVLPDAEWRNDANKYQIKVSGTWYDVPDIAMRDPVGGENPTGAAVAWYSKMDGGIRIYCFAPGSLY